MVARGSAAGKTEADSRADEVRRELAVVDRDHAKAISAAKPRRRRLDEIGSELGEIVRAVEEADAEITRAAERIARVDVEQASIAKEEEFLAQRLAGMDDAAAVWRTNLAAAEPVPTDAVIDAFGRHRLLSFDRDPASREPTVEIAHEALLDAWKRLRTWIDEGREDLRQNRRIDEAAACMYELQHEVLAAQGIPVQGVGRQPFRT